MAPRKKEPAKPLLATKFDFVESLNALIQAGIMLDQAVNMAFELGKESDGGDYVVRAPTRQLLKERADAFRKALFTEDGQG